MDDSARVQCWTWGRFLADVVLVAIVYAVSGIAAFLIAATVMMVRRDSLDVNSEDLGITGMLPLLVFATAIACVPLVRYLAGRCEKSPWEFLGVRPCRTRYIALACGVTVVSIAACDLMTAMLGRSIVPEFMRDAFAEGGASRRWLFAAVVFAAPISEELIFRGFLFGGLRACGASVAVSVAAVSILFAAVHVQYDAYDATVVFVLGLLYIGARVHSGSVVPGMMMHGLTNAIAYVETALLS